MTVLVIGSKGQDGSILCDLLEANKQSYVAVSRSEIRLADGSIRGPVNLSKSHLASDFLDEIHPSAIVHLAAVHAPSGSMHRMGNEKFCEMVKCHIDISRNILNWQVRYPDSKSIFALSSQMFSAEKQHPLIGINSPINPSTKYGETKAACWKMLNEYRVSKKVNSIGLILFNHTSDRSKENFLFPEIAKQLVGIIEGKEESITIRDANAYIDIHSAYDLAAGILKIIEKDFVRDFIFSSGNYFMIKSIIEESIARLGLSKNIRINSTRETLPAIPLHGDISETQQLLGWLPSATPSEILVEMTKGQKFAK